MANMRYGYLRQLEKDQSTTIKLAPTAKLDILMKRHSEVTGHKYAGAEVDVAGNRIGVVVRIK